MSLLACRTQRVELSEAENELSAATTCPPTPSGLDGEDDTRIDRQELLQLAPPVKRRQHEPKFIDCNESVLLGMGNELDLAPPVDHQIADGHDVDEARRVTNYGSAEFRRGIRHGVLKHHARRPAAIGACEIALITRVDIVNRENRESANGANVDTTHDMRS